VTLVVYLYCSACSRWWWHSLEHHSFAHWMPVKCCKNPDDMVVMMCTKDLSSRCRLLPL